MPKQTPSIPNDIILSKLGNREALSDELLILPAQLGILLCRSVEQLAEDRKVGNPPPFVKVGGSIRYRLGTVRNYLFSLPQFNNTTQMRIETERADLGIPSAGFLLWLDHAHPNKRWPFLIRTDAGPIDFWASLSLGEKLADNDWCEWLSLDKYLKLRRHSAWSLWLRDKGERGENGDEDATVADADRQISDAMVNKLWGAARLFQVIDAARSRRQLLPFERDIMIGFLDAACAAFIRDKAAEEFKDKPGDVGGRRRMIESMKADLERLKLIQPASQ